MRSVAVLLAVIFLLPAIVVAQDDVDALALQAETAYRAGDFTTATRLYKQLLADGIRNGAVYLNLGNAYYELHDLGNAMLSYRRAAISMPRDEDLRTNIARVAVQRGDGITMDTDIRGQISALTADRVSLTELGWIVVLLVWLAAGVAIAYLKYSEWRPKLRWILVGVVAALLLLTFMLVTRIVIDSELKPAVVMEAVVPVMTGPGMNYMEIYELHAGADIRVVEERNHWVRFRLPDMREGWINEQAIEVV